MEFKILILIALTIINFGFIHGDESVDTADDEKVIVEIIAPAPENCERKSKNLDQLSMHYVGTLSENGKKFDSSHDRGKTFDFQIGTGQVIKGWDEGLLDMCVGEKRKLIVPSKKGYGEAGAGDVIPPNAGLTFEVELMKIEDGKAPPNIFKQIDTNGDKLLEQDEISNFLKARAAEGGHETNEDEHKELVTHIFSTEDKDKDGYISHEEFSGPKHDEL